MTTRGNIYILNSEIKTSFLNPTIVIADDHPLMLRGLSDFLTSKGYNILGSAQDGQSAYNLIIKHNPDIAVLDIRMPHKTGIEVAEECQKNNLETKIVLITFDKEEELYDKALELGIYGYILKEFAIDEIEACLENVKLGKPYFSEEITNYLIKSQARPKEINELTKTEKHIVQLVSKNNSSQEIADILSISIRTVEKHRSNIVSKLKLGSSKSALVVWATMNKELLKNTW